MSATTLLVIVLLRSTVFASSIPHSARTPTPLPAAIQQPDHFSRLLGHPHHSVPEHGPPGQWQHSSGLRVDLGYAIYQGYVADNGFNTWQGMRYASAPTGDLRWRAPTAPETNRSVVVNATGIPYRCPNAPNDAGFGTPPVSDEDCLYLSVYAPRRARNLPVIFYIHGGGYAQGDGGEDLTTFNNINDNKFVNVVIQYRLGAFGFLSSTAIHDDGNTNAGLLDQYAALKWVQANIARFGGDPRRVTIAGQSAGAGSVEMLAMANGGADGDRYFQYGIAASPYTPVMYNYDDSYPEQNYLNFAKMSGCYSGTLSGTSNRDQSVLSCLRNADSQTLQDANTNVSASVGYGSFAFVPVVDGTFLPQRPSIQLNQGKVNGLGILTGHNSNEGSQFVYGGINTASDFNTWLKSEYPRLTSTEIDQINNVYYPYENEGTSPYATCGDCGGATDINVGSFATGHQQRAIDFYGEATFQCPSLWLAGAYESSNRGGGGWGWRGRGGRGGRNSPSSGYKYQYSLPFGQHGADLVTESFIGGDLPNSLIPQIGPDLRAALTTAFGNFISSGNPSISNLLANGESTGNTSTNPASHWPLYTTTGRDKYQMLDINQTSISPPFINNIRQIDAETWEGGLIARCEFLRRIGIDIPE